MVLPPILVDGTCPHRPDEDGLINERSHLHQERGDMHRRLEWGVPPSSQGFLEAAYS